MPLTQIDKIKAEKDDIINLQMEAYDAGYLKCIKDIIVSDKLSLIIIDDELRYKFFRFTPQSVMALLQDKDKE